MVEKQIDLTKKKTVSPFIEEENDGGRTAQPHLHAAHSLFPSVLCYSVMQIVACLDDAAVSSDGCAVYEIAYQVPKQN